MKPVTIAALAEEDLRDACEWYERRSAGAGNKLLDAVDRCLQQISDHPLRFPVVHLDVRRTLVQSFAFAIFYRDLPGEVRIVAVVHQHRDPKVWQRRR